MAKRIYIETTIPSFYFEARSKPDMVARREWTRNWWDDASARNELVTSVAVIEEPSRWDFPARHLVTPLELLGDDDEDER